MHVVRPTYGGTSETLESCGVTASNFCGSPTSKWGKRDLSRKCIPELSFSVSIQTTLSQQRDAFHRFTASKVSGASLV
jgi:hypothetical protein